jgi:hypothetical protein
MIHVESKETKYMIACGSDRTIPIVGQSVVFGDKTFEVAKEFVYLGFWNPW